VRCGVGHDCNTGGHSGRTRRRSKVSQVEPGVGPLLQDRADEALGLALGLGPVGAGYPVANIPVRTDIGEGVALGIAEGSVGEHGLDRDPASAKYSAARSRNPAAVSPRSSARTST